MQAGNRQPETESGIGNWSSEMCQSSIGTATSGAARLCRVRHGRQAERQEGGPHLTSLPNWPCAERTHRVNVRSRPLARIGEAGSRIGDSHVAILAPLRSDVRPDVERRPRTPGLPHRNPVPAILTDADEGGLDFGADLHNDKIRTWHIDEAVEPALSIGSEA